MYELTGSKLENPFSFAENTDDVKMQMGMKKGNLRKEIKWGSTVRRNVWKWHPIECKRKKYLATNTYYDCSKKFMPE